MSRYCIYIDGFNVYYALQQPSYRKYKWLNYRKLAESVIGNDDLYDKALILSADSDLIPAIQVVHKYTPDKKIGVMFPIGRNNNDLKAEADFRIKMPQKLLQACQFPEQIKIGNKIIKRPESWR